MTGPGASLPATRAARLRSLERLEAVRAKTLVVARDPSPEAVHDLRVALRRLRAAIDLFEAPHQLVRELKALDEALARCRDRQVRLEWLLGPGVPRAARALGKREEQRLRTELPAAVATAVRWHERRAEAFAEALGQLELPGRFEGHRLHHRLAKWARAVDRQVDQLDAPPSTKQAHRLRLRVKKLRYGAEVLREVDPKTLGKLLPVIRRLQTVLGDLHDADLRAAWLRQNERRKRPRLEMLRKLERKVERERRREARRLGKAAKAWTEVAASVLE